MSSHAKYALRSLLLATPQLANAMFALVQSGASCVSAGIDLFFVVRKEDCERAARALSARRAGALEHCVRISVQIQPIWYMHYSLT